jgi:salicylate hydroxylase
MASHAPILIAGGGIGGLALAIALARDGRPSVVLERQAEFSAAGAGIQIGPNGVRVLQKLGVADALRPLVGVPEAIIVNDGARGRPLARLPLGAWIEQRYAAPYWVAHRGDLHAVLARRAEAESPVVLRTGFEVTGFSAGESGVTVTGAAGETVHGAALIGADGLWSAVRGAMEGALGAPAMPAPEFAGATATRTVIPAADAGGLAVPAVGLWLGPAAHVVHYPVRGGSEIAVVVIAHAAWQGRDWDADADPTALRTHLAAFHASLTDVLRQVPAWRRWALHTLPDLPLWTDGPVALLGDAAHPMLPYLAQGGAIALEDALVLAGCVRDAPAVPEALAAYAALRRPRARRAQLASQRQGRLYRLPQPLSLARDAVLRLIPGTLLMQRLAWLHGWQPDP